jgi:molybdopterin converting factor small subunit
VPRLSFTASLERHVACPAETVDGASVRGVLEAYFARHPRVRTYVLDEQGALRQHVVIFVSGKQVRDRSHLADPVGDGDDIWVMQALSGG